MKRGDILGRYAIIPQSNESLAAADATQLAQYMEKHDKFLTALYTYSNVMKNRS
jgi:hypothetical protein